jgi:predicted tellurium resistance membrane protein TerC
MADASKPDYYNKAIVAGLGGAVTTAIAIIAKSHAMPAGWDWATIIASGLALAVGVWSAANKVDLSNLHLEELLAELAKRDTATPVQVDVTTTETIPAVRSATAADKTLKAYP